MASKVHVSEFIEKLLEILVKQKSLSETQAADLKKGFRESSPPDFEAYLLDSAQVSKASLLKALGSYYKLPAFDVSGYLFDHDLVKELPKDVMLRNSCVPVEVDQDILVVVANEPSDDLAVTLESYLKNDIQFNVGLYQDIKNAIEEFYDEAITEEPSEDPYYRVEEEDERIEKILDTEDKRDL